MKRQRAFLESSNPAPMKRKTPLAVTIGKPLPPTLNQSQKMQVKRMIMANAEKKDFLAGLAVEAIGNVAVISSCANVPLGDGDGQRIGSDITVTGVHFKCDITMTDATNIFRVIVFKWKENDQFSVPTAAQILVPGPSGGIEPLSYYNRNTTQTYEILWDKTIIGSTGATGGPPVRFFFERYMHPRAYKSKFYTSAGITGTNKIYRLCISDSAAVTHPFITWNSQLIYSDA